jgi:hypothetical protein
LEWILRLAGSDDEAVMEDMDSWSLKLDWPEKGGEQEISLELDLVKVSVEVP